MIVMLRPSIFQREQFNLSNYFDEFQKSFFGELGGMFNSFKTDILDKGDYFELQADLPGFSKEEIEIGIQGDYLTISAEHKEESKEEKDNYIHQERRYGSYQRSFNVANIDTNLINAEYKDGVLNLKLPKLEQIADNNRKIEVK